MSNQLTIRQDPAADWTSRNPVLAQYEVGYESNTGKAKLGDGVTAWNSLGYWNPAQGNVKAYRALLTQSGTDAPAATVLENTLGETPTPSYNGTGDYTFSTVGNVFTENKTFFVYPSTICDPGTGVKFIKVTRNNAGSYNIATANAEAAGGGALAVPSAADGILTNFPLTILVYP